MSKKKKNSIIDRRGTVLIDETYDGFKDLVNDGRDQSRYTNFRVSNVLMKVEKDEYAIVVNRLNPKDIKVITEPGLYRMFRYSKYIYVPNPVTPMIVDFKPVNEEDKKMNFTFTPNLTGNLEGEVDGQDELFIDYRIHFKWASGDAVKQYYYSVNPMQNIQATIVSLLREFVAKNNKKDLMADFSKYGIETIDPKHKLQDLAFQYGLIVVDFDVKNIKLSEAVQAAKNKASVSIEEAKARKKTAKIDRETAQINAEANIAGFKETVKFAEEGMGLKPNDPKVMALMQMLNDREIAKTGKAVYIGGRGSGSYLDSASIYSAFQEFENNDSESHENNGGRKR